MVFTSGATGPAKGVVYRHRQVEANRDALVRLYGITPAGPARGRLRAVRALRPGHGHRLSRARHGRDRAGHPRPRPAPRRRRRRLSTPRSSGPRRPRCATWSATPGELDAGQRAALGSVRLRDERRRPGPASGSCATCCALLPAARGAHAVRHDRGAPGHRHRAHRARARRGRRGRLRGPAGRRSRGADQRRWTPSAGRPAGSPTASAEVTGEILVRAPWAKDRYDRLAAHPGRVHGDRRLAPHRGRRAPRRRRAGCGSRVGWRTSSAPPTAR